MKMNEDECHIFLLTPCVVANIVVFIIKSLLETSTNRHIH